MRKLIQKSALILLPTLAFSACTPATEDTQKDSNQETPAWEREAEQRAKEIREEPKTDLPKSFLN